MPKTTSKREDILQAARRVFSYYGFDGGTLDKIAKEAGVSAPLIIKFFGNKQTIMRILIERWSEKKYIEEHFHKPCRAFEAGVFAGIKENRDEWRYMLSMMMTPALGDIFGDFSSGYLSRWTQYYTQHADELRDPGKAFEIAYTMIGLNFNYILGSNEENHAKAKEEAFRQYLKD